MIYVTGDIHGDISRFYTRNFPEKKGLTKSDYLIICGDFGLVWDYRGETPEEKDRLNYLDNMPCTVLFCDGNHENFDRLNQYPIGEWNGGLVHVLRPNVLHLMRGEVFDIDGRRTFAFGGAASHDIQGEATAEELKEDYTAGVLRPDDPDFDMKCYKLRKNGIFTRIEGMSWWRDEMPSRLEMENGRQNLAKVGGKVDLIISHDMPTSDLESYYSSFSGYVVEDPEINVLNRYLEEIKQNTEYKKWYFGHHHADRQINEKDTLIYEKVEQVEW